MVDSGVRIAAAFLPAGVPVVVGIVLAVLRRRVMPRVSLPAIIGLALQLVILLISAFLVGFLGLLPAQGWSPEGIRTLSSVLGFLVIVLQLVSWTLILVALFTRLPARALDRTPTGRHALVDESGEQVVAEEGTTLLPIAAGIAGAGAGGAAAASSTDAPVWETPPLQPAGPPRTGDVDDEPAETETIAATPGTGPHPSSFPAPGTTANPDEPTTAEADRIGPDGALDDDAAAPVTVEADDEHTPAAGEDLQADDLQPDDLQPDEVEPDGRESDDLEPEATPAPVPTDTETAGDTDSASPPTDEDDPSDDVPADDVAQDPAQDPADDDDLPEPGTGAAVAEPADAAGADAEPAVGTTTPDSPVSEDEALADHDDSDPDDDTPDAPTGTAPSTSTPATSTPPIITPPTPAPSTTTSPTTGSSTTPTSAATPSPSPGGTTGGAHPWFTPTGTGNPATSGPTADEETDVRGAHPTEARPAGSSEHS